MKKIFSFIFIFFIFFICAGCEFELLSDVNPHSPNPYKGNFEGSGFDCIAFAGQHFLQYRLSNGEPNEDVEFSDDEIEYICSPFGRSNKNSPFKIDILGMNILNDEQKQDFEYYCKITGANHFKMAFCISNDINSEYYGKQIIWLVNLTVFKSQKILDEFGQTLYYESTILDFNKILDAAKISTSLDEISQQLLNNYWSGIFLHNYQNKDNEITLNFYMIDYIVNEDITLFMTKFDVSFMY